MYPENITYIDPGLKINVDVAYINFESLVDIDMTYTYPRLEFNNGTRGYTKRIEIINNHKIFHLCIQLHQTRKYL